MKYRIILRRFEFDRMMAPREKLYDLVGRPIRSHFFPPTYFLKKSSLDAEFLSLSISFRTLYAILQLDGDILHDGICNFLQGCHPMYWLEAYDALDRIGAIEFRDKYSEELKRILGNEILDELPALISSGDEVEEFRSNLEDVLTSRRKADPESCSAFQVAYRDVDRLVVDHQLRTYLRQCDPELFCICDGDQNLERAWFRTKLEVLIHPYKEWIAFTKLHPGPFFGGYRLTFTSDALLRLGVNKVVQNRNRKADRILRLLFDQMQSDLILDDMLTYQESPTPHITIQMKKGWFRVSRLVVEYTEDQRGTPSWRISNWD